MSSSSGSGSSSGLGLGIVSKPFAQSSEMMELHAKAEAKRLKILILNWLSSPDLTHKQIIKKLDTEYIYSPLSKLEIVQVLLAIREEEEQQQQNGTNTNTKNVKSQKTIAYYATESEGMILIRPGRLAG